MSSSYAQRSFEADLSPIIEDTVACMEPLSLNEASLVASIADGDDSGSTQSYGQLLEDLVSRAFHCLICLLSLRCLNSEFNFKVHLLTKLLYSAPCFDVI